MPNLILRGHRLESMFELLGREENDMTGSLGWTLSRSDSLTAAILHEVGLPSAKAREVEVRLQQYEAGRGFTDIEIESPRKFCVIIEAKRGPNLPSRSQLMRYARRTRFRRYGSKSKRLVVISECSPDYAAMRLGTYRGLGASVTPLSWQRVAAIARMAATKAPRAEKRTIDELLAYLQGLTNSAEKRLDSNWVYVVALSNQRWRSPLTFIEIVEKKHRYFHSVGPHRLAEPPTYIAFRYNGELKSIHYVEKCERVTNVGARIPEVSSAEHDPMDLYYLGPAFHPDHKVPTGNRIHRANRVWCMLDTLFTCRTISDAWQLSRKRGA